MRFWSVLHVLLLVTSIHCLSIDDAEDIISFTASVVKHIHEAWEQFDVQREPDHSLVFRTKHEKMIGSLERVTHMVERIERDVPQTSVAAIKQLESNLIVNLRLSKVLDKLIDTISEVSSAYEKFMDLQPREKVNKYPDGAQIDTESVPYEDHTLLDFATRSVSFDSKSVSENLKSIHEMIVPRRDTTIYHYHDDVFSVIKNSFNNSNLHCVLGQSLHQALFNLFSSLRIAQLKGLVILQYSYMILRINNKGNFTKEKDTAVTLFRERFRKQTFKVKEILDTSDNSLWQCDPQEHIRGVTYTELTRLLQGYITNENDLSNRHNCYEGCEFYKYVPNDSCTKDTFCEYHYNLRCGGRVVDCRKIGNTLDICLSGEGSTRRYDRITIENGYSYGKSSCNTGVSTRVEYWRKFLFFKCYYCLCICDDVNSLMSDRYFNLKEYTSNVHENKVVTGVKFVKRNRIIHVQIEQGMLQPKGIINKSTKEWLPLADYTVHTNTIEGSKPVGEPNKDYYVLNYLQRALDLDDIRAPPRSLVTGVRFRVIGVHLNLEIRITPFNLENGTLSPERSQWVGNDNTDAEFENPRKVFNLPSEKVPTLSTDSVIDAQSDSFLEFTHSDVDSDLAQSTVPFIDTQPVVPDPPIPLSGIGISHKGTKSTSGFVMLKVFTFNLSERLSAADFAEL